MKNVRFTKALLMSFFVLFWSFSFAQKDENKSQFVFITGPRLFEQIEGTQWELQNSQKYNDAQNKDMTCEMADDFDVPVGQTWNVKTVIAYGFMSNILDTVNVYIYADNGGKPGSLLHSYPSILRSNGGFKYFTGFMGAANNGVYQIELPTAVSLTAGKYWLSVQADNSFDSYDDKWSWFNCTSSYDKNFYWRNPLDGSFTGYTDWTDGAIVNQWGIAFGASFVLCAPRIANDISILSIDTPIDGTLTNSEIIKVTIINYGTSTQTGFNIKYKIDNGNWITENVGSLSVAAGSQKQYSFTAHGDFSEVSLHNISVSTSLSTDGNTNNDLLSTSVNNYGTIYTYTQFDDITTCNGTFTDQGGISNDWFGAFTDTVTIYPNGANLRSRLTFLEFDNGWGEFWIYDGKNVNAPPIDLTPDNNNTLFAFDQSISTQVTAKNIDGALTIVFNTEDGETAKGWIAKISCYQPPSDDFQLTKIYADKYTLFNGDVTNINVVVYNAGLNVQSKEVTINVNGILLGTATSRTLNPNESDTVSIEWSPALLGAYELSAQIPADGGENSLDNSISTTTEVYENGYLVESFEGQVFPPESWTTKIGIWQRRNINGNLDLNADGDYYIDFINGEHDTLITPKLIINQDDILRFRAYSQMWWQCNLNIYWSESPEGPWNLISQVPLSGFATSLEECSVDISAAAGNNYIAFITDGGEYGWTKSMRIDFVRGPKIFYYNNDLKASNLICDITPTQNQAHDYKFTVKNLGLTNLIDGDYTVKLMQKNEGSDIELASQQGTALNSMASKDFTFSYVFNDVISASIYAKIVYAADQNIDDNVTRQTEIWVQAEQTEYFNVGNFTNYSIGVAPFSGFENGEVNQTIYLPSEVGANGTITGITYYFRNQYSSNYLDIPIQVWIGETTETDLANGFIPSSEMSLVFDENVNFYSQTEGEFFINFNVPYIYTGKNLVVMFYHKNTQSFSNVEFIVGSTNLMKRTTRAVYLFGDVDLNDVEALNNNQNHQTNEFFAKTTFHRKTLLMGTIAGLVKDFVTNAPIVDADIYLMNTTAVVKSLITGDYVLPVVPEGTQTVKAVKFGYNDNIINEVVVANQTTNVNFLMNLKPQVTVTGKVVRSDDNTGIANLNIPLLGYQNYMVSTDANGNFTIPNVYANEIYNLTIEYPHFLTYSNNNVNLVEGQNLDLGTIVLQENFETSFYVNANEVNNNANITWNIPYSGTNSILNLWDEEGFSNGYTADANEDVWLGNYFDVNENGTITGFDIQLWNYPGYDYLNGNVTIDIFNAEQELVTSQPFNIPSYNTEFYTIHIDIPNVTFNKSFYAMIHYQNLGFYTPLIGFESGYISPAPNLARVKYENKAIQPFSDLIGSFGIFEISANVILLNGKTEILDNSPKSLLGYNIYRGLVSDMQNAETWTKLNSNLLNSNNYDDQTWTNVDAGFYTYAVEAVYTEGLSSKSFSNPISSGIYGSLNLNITTNGNEFATGAKINLTNNNGDETYFYNTQVVDNNTANLPKIMNGNYTLSVSLPFYDVYTNNSYDINPTIQTLDIELNQTINTPTQLEAVVNNTDKEVQLTWNLGDVANYILDDETFEQSLNISTTGEGWIGNKFDVNDIGYINSIDIYGSQTQTGVGTELVTIDILDASGNLIGTSETFEILADQWNNVVLPNIQFDGNFYAMVHYKYVDANMVAADINGQNMTAGYYKDNDLGLITLESLNMACALGIRVNAHVLGTTQKTFSTENNIFKNQVSNILNIQKTVNSVATNNEKTANTTFNIYLNNMTIPVASDVTTYNYLITSDLLNTFGNYNVGVASVYYSGMSDIVTTQFNFTGVGIDNSNVLKTSVYPTPANNVLHIENSQSSKAFLINQAGLIIKSYEIDADNYSIDLTNIKSGSYILKINKNGISQNHKIVIVK